MTSSLGFKNEQMKKLLILLNAFFALTAIGGGLAILLGIDNFPLKWLEGTPFPNYTIPALILAVPVGGMALVAMLALALRKKRALDWSFLAGWLMVGFIVVEVLILQQEPPGPTNIELFYFSLALLLVMLSWYSANQKR